VTDDAHGRSEPASGLAASSSSSPEAVQALYDEWVSTYDADVEQWGYDAPDRLAALVVEADAARGEVLDAGCGTGRAGRALRQAGVRTIVGIDFSIESLAVARQSGDYAETQHLDLNDPLPFTSNRFAAVVSAGVFSYLQAPGAVLRELVRVTRPNGLVVFTQRTDLWAERKMDKVLRQLATEQRCHVETSRPVPYLPGHVEFGDAVEVIDTVISVG
jgi:predicted TPR repeat methyltransferase